MSSIHNFWNLGLSGTTQVSPDPRFLGVLNLFVRRQLVFRDIRTHTTTHGYCIEEARATIVLPPAFLELPGQSCLYIETVLARFGVDRRHQSSFAMRILRATHGLSRLYPRGIRITATLDRTIVQISEVEDLIMREVMEQLNSESDHVPRGASKSTVLGLKEKVYSAEDKDCCSICLEEFHRVEKVTELPCSHVFHHPCIIQWLESSNSCPLCRHELDTSDT